VPTPEPHVKGWDRTDWFCDGRDGAQG